MDITGSFLTLKEASPTNSLVTCVSHATESSPLLCYHRWDSVRQSCWAALGGYGLLVCRRDPTVF